MLRQHPLRLVLALALGAAAGQAYAFGLGSIKIQSYLGQPLRAEISITQLTPDEAASLKVGLASPNAYRAERLNYSDALGSVKVSLRRHADGTPYLLVTSDRPVREPFLDLLIRAQWSSGELSREYTVLLDPPNLAASAAPQPQIAAQAPEQPITPAAASASAPLAPPLPRQTKPVRPPAPAAAAATGGTYVVKRGDTLSKVAREIAVPTVSLDQMLTALYRENTGAFIDQNINLLKAGAVLRLPSAEQAASVSPVEARRFVIAQSRNFAAYRERLAGVVAQSKPAAGGGSRRESGGPVQAKVEEPAAAASAPHSTLKLSKAEVKGSSVAQQIAEQKQAAADEAKIAQLQKNIEALKAAAKEAEAAAKAAAGGTAPTEVAAASRAAGVATLPAAAPGLQTPAKPASAAPAHPASAAASSPGKAGASAAAAASHPAVAGSHAVAAGPGASAPHAASAPPAVRKPAPAPQPEPSLLSTLLASPLLLPAGGGIVILLLLLALLLQRRKKAMSQRDVSVFDSRMSVADSFFGGTGGERVDTRNSSSVASTFSSSQIDTNDVDPVAEADVYLAYGRDLQAEEILKEAIKANPERNAARLKLLEIYAKRKDTRSFEVAAAELFALTQGVGEDWQKAQELGRGLDPVNPLYHNTVPPSTLGAPSTVPQTDLPAATGLAAIVPPTLPNTEMLSNVPGAQAKAALPESLDLDLSLPLSSEAPVAASSTVSTSAAPSPSTAATPRAEPAQTAAPSAVPTRPEAPQAAAPQQQPPVVDNDFLASGLDFTVPSRFAQGREPEADAATAATAAAAAASAPAASSPETPLEFDLSGITLDTGADASQPSPPAARAQTEHAPGQSRFADSQPLDIRFELAAESLAIGDTEAARNLLEELKAEGDAAVRARAQEMLDKIGR